jgi:hypothetical protein
LEQAFKDAGMSLLFVWLGFDGRAEKGGRKTDRQTGRVHEQAFAREAKQRDYPT